MLVTLLFSGCVQNNNSPIKNSELQKTLLREQIISHVKQCATGIENQKISRDLRVRVIFRLNLDGSLQEFTTRTSKLQHTGGPIGSAFGGTEYERHEFTREFLRYILRCAPYDFLPKDQYELWAHNEITFNPSVIFD